MISTSQSHSPSQSHSSTRGAGLASGRPRLPNLLREPLLHFILLGGLLFAADHFINASAADSRIIRVDAKVDEEARRLFKDARGREPNADELYALRKVWLDNEVLYREGLALQVDKGDSAIRDRVIFKALSVIDAGLKLPPYDEKLLRDWFEQHRAKYDQPARFDFEEAVLAGENTEAASRAFAQALNAGAPGNAQAGLRVFKDRPLPNLDLSYGPEFGQALEKSPVGEWRALPSKAGFHVVKLTSFTPSQAATFENLSGVVLQDWTDETMSAQRSAAVRAMADKYTIKVEVPVVTGVAAGAATQAK